MALLCLLTFPKMRRWFGEIDLYSESFQSVLKKQGKAGAQHSANALRKLFNQYAQVSYLLLISYHLSPLSFSCLCIYFERESVSTREWRKGREREGDRERERIPSRLCSVSTEPDMALDPTNHKIMTRAEIKSQPLNQLSHPGAPTTRSSICTH